MPGLMSVLRGADEKRAIEAAAGLGELGGVGVVAPLEMAARGDNVLVAVAATGALGDIDLPEAVAALVRVLTGDCEQHVHAEAVAVLANRRSVRAARALLAGAACTPSAETRRAALEVLTRWGPKTAAVLVPALSSKDERVQAAAAQALAVIGLPPDQNVVQPALRCAAALPDGQPKEGLLAALGALGEVARPALCIALREDAKSRSLAAQALSDVGVPDDVVTRTWHGVALGRWEEVQALGWAAMPTLLEQYRKGVKVKGVQRAVLGIIEARGLAGVPALVEALQAGVAEAPVKATVQAICEAALAQGEEGAQAVCDVQGRLATGSDEERFVGATLAGILFQPQHASAPSLADWRAELLRRACEGRDHALTDAIGPGAVPALIEMVWFGELDGKKWALERLNELDDTGEAVSALKDVVECGGLREQEWALDRLHERTALGPAEVPALTEWLRRSAYRSNKQWALERLDELSATGQALSALNDVVQCEDPGDREWAVLRLHERSALGPAAVPALVEWARRSVLQPDLVGCLDHETRGWALKRLCELDALTEPDLMVWHDLIVQDVGYREVARRHGPLAVAPLTSFWDMSSHAEVLEALSSIRHPTAATELASLCRATVHGGWRSDYVNDAIAALGSMGDAGVPELSALTSGAHLPLDHRLAAAKELARTEGGRELALRTLEALCTDMEIGSWERYRWASQLAELTHTDHPAVEAAQVAYVQDVVEALCEGSARSGEALKEAYDSQWLSTKAKRSLLEQRPRIEADHLHRDQTPHNDHTESTESRYLDCKHSDHTGAHTDEMYGVKL